jgi:hypothetical protein
VQLAGCSWADAKLLPGALRVLRHLHRSGLPIAVATSTPRATLQRKLANKPELRELLARAVCGDEVGGTLAFSCAVAVRDHCSTWQAQHDLVGKGGRVPASSRVCVCGGSPCATLACAP